MNKKVAQQEDKPELTDHLAKAGIKVPERKIKRRGEQLLNQMDTNVKMGGTTNPNSGSSYKGIF